MISLVVTAVVTVAATILRGAVAIVGFILKITGRLLRLLFSILPVTGTVLVLVCVYLVVFSISGTDHLPLFLPFHPDGRPFMAAFSTLLMTIMKLRQTYPGILSILITVAAVILAIPVLTVMLLIYAFLAITPVIVFVLGAEAVIYLIWGILSHRSPLEQIERRYYALFPKSADRHYERKYHDWLRRHADEFDDDTFGMPGAYGRSEKEYARRRRIDDYYGEDDDGYGYEDEYEEPEEPELDVIDISRRSRPRTSRYIEDDRYDRRYEEEYDDDPGDDYDGDYDDDYDDEYDEAYDDDYDEDDYDDDEASYESHDRGRDSRGGKGSGADGPRSSFDFFAGCRDLAGVEKKYRSLVKIYHPDNQDGDTSAIQEINMQYAEAKKRFR